ncbi:hypothetical protein [Gulosibacter bifidus]|uniref:Uncharacterized protein n=1 Tax=Gulosibacter bifidus TaxID=272239 RepID=A0ABW5RL71_9MICO
MLACLACALALTLALPEP